MFNRKLKREIAELNVALSAAQRDATTASIHAEQARADTTALRDRCAAQQRLVESLLTRTGAIETFIDLFAEGNAFAQKVQQPTKSPTTRRRKAAK